MSTQFPTEPHEFALWLIRNLEDLQNVGGSTLWEGKLPTRFDFKLVESNVESLPNAFGGPCRFETRKIGFHPTSVNVYQNLEQLLLQARNRTRVPSRFTLLDEKFSYPGLAPNNMIPERVTRYLDVVNLFSVLKKLADAHNGGLLFVASHEAQLTILPDFCAQDLRPLYSLQKFVAEFANEESHFDQKRSVVRTVLLEQFRPRKLASMAELLEKFDDIATDARHSLAMYMAEFSVAKVKAEVERQNLDDTLSLNKILSDIQNQLLALPAAILLAGATIKPEENFRNYAVLGGMIVFAIFVMTLISNQRHSLDAISKQIARRKKKVNDMPSGSSATVLPLFEALELRVSKQQRTLRFISSVVFSIVLLTGFAVIDVNSGGAVVQVVKGAWAWAASVAQELCHLGTSK